MIGAGADVPGCQVLLEGQVREGVPACGRFDQQAVARDLVEERFTSDRRGEAFQLGPDDFQDAVGGEAADVLAHHLVGERGQERLFNGPGQQRGEVLGLITTRKQDVADLPVEVGAAVRQCATVPVCRGDHRQQQWIGRQVAQCRMLR